MLKITIHSLTNKKADKVVSMLKEINHSNYIVNDSSGTSMTNRIKRIEFVYQCFLFKLKKYNQTSLSDLFRYARRRGYGMNYRTIAKDVDTLVEEGRMSKNVITGGAKGKYMILTRGDENKLGASI